MVRGQQARPERRRREPAGPGLRSAAVGVSLNEFRFSRSYNPFDGPNENPEAELPLTAGKYLYVYGDMDEDGFYEGQPERGGRLVRGPGPPPPRVGLSGA